MTVVAALEDLVDGQSHDEQEKRYYGTIVNFDQLKNADQVIFQEQYGIPVVRDGQHKGQVRVRQKKDREGEGFVFTIKVRQPDGSDKECNLQGTADALDLMKQLAADGMVKDRYCFPVDGTDLFWEIDMTRDGQGGYFPVCRIELELPKGFKGEIPDFPIELTDVLDHNDPDPAVQAKIKEYFEKYFRVQTGN